MHKIYMVFMSQSKSKCNNFCIVYVGNPRSVSPIRLYSVIVSFSRFNIIFSILWWENKNLKVLEVWKLRFYSCWWTRISIIPIGEGFFLYGNVKESLRVAHEIVMRTITIQRVNPRSANGCHTIGDRGFPTNDPELFIKDTHIIEIIVTINI